MTQKEIEKFLTNTKVYVNGKSKEIQEKLFSLGYKWCDGYTKVDYTDCPFLYIYEESKFISGNNMVNFSDNENREITAEEILSLELTKPKFDPKTLKPFDRVVVRDTIRNWKCGLFSHIKDSVTEYKYSCIGSDYVYCIPYNEETKYLLGTADEAPEYYRYWED